MTREFFLFFASDRMGCFRSSAKSFFGPLAVMSKPESLKPDEADRKDQGKYTLSWSIWIISGTGNG
ncbi:MAG: hypothetical protein OXD44_11135 [Gammaproteobacteria bacterium]|nr:hypothetical protein [Gammaproteobacteria bacterium]MCY4226348.1 hypothetical protein [Gammaproteobacteria bacterium]MCY4314220.1 hypothetical protein [Gammaproteobacteria bacterium]